MYAASTILYLKRFRSRRYLNPNISFSRISRQSEKPISGIGSAFGGKSCFLKPRTMIKMTVAFGDGVRALEHEALVNKHSAEVNGFESKWAVSALFGAAVIWRHDGATLWSMTGSLVNTLLSAVLKRVLNQERPVPRLRSDPGNHLLMPKPFSSWSLLL